MPAKSTRLDFAGGRGLVVCYAGNSVALIAAAIAVRIKSLRCGCFGRHVFPNPF